MEIIMPRISPVPASQPDTIVAGSLARIKAQMGKIPNTFATIAKSPAALEGYLGLASGLRRGRLTPRQRELLALAVAQANECQYCLSAHTASGKAVGLTPDQVQRARAAKSDNPLENAILSLAMKVLEQRGLVSGATLTAAREAGVDDGLIIEIIANIALNTLTNFTNRLADPDIDFPVVQVRQ